MLSKEIRNQYRMMMVQGYRLSDKQIFKLLDTLDAKDQELAHLHKENLFLTEDNAKLHADLNRLEEEKNREIGELSEVLKEIKRHNSDTVTNDRRIRHIIGQIVDRALGEGERG